MKETATFRLDKDLMDKMRKNAFNDHRSLNNYVELILLKLFKDEKENPE